MAVAIRDEVELLRQREERLQALADQLKAQRDAVLDQLREVRIEIDRQTRAPVRVLAAMAGRRGKPIALRHLDAVAAMVEQLGEATTPEVAQHLNISDAQARERLRRLEELGNVARRGLRRQTRWFIPGGQEIEPEALVGIPSQAQDYRAKVRDIGIELGTFVIADVEAAGVSYPTARKWLEYWTERGTFERELIDGRSVYAYVAPKGEPVNRPKRQTPEDQLKGYVPRKTMARTRGNWLARLEPEVRDYLAELEAAGCQITPGGHGHHKILWQGSYVSTLPRKVVLIEASREQARAKGVPI